MPTLSDYQEYALERLLRNPRNVEQRKYGLFDEQGVGKTAPTIMAMWEQRNDYGDMPWLVTAPSYLLGNWARELKLWLPEAKVVVANHEERSRRSEQLNENAHFILTGYHTWNRLKVGGEVRFHPQFNKRRWQGLTFDEAHRLRGRNSDWTKRLFQLQNVDSKNKDAWYWFLTGTPIVRDAGDVWPFLHLCNRPVYRSYWNYVRSVCFTDVTPWEEVIGDVRDPVAFQNIMQRYSLRRLAKSIPQLADLEHSEKTIWVDLPPSVSQALQRAKKTYVMSHPDMDDKAYESGGALMIDLLRMSTKPPTQANPKIETLIDWLRNEAPNERVGIGVWFRASAQEVKERLEKAFKGRRVLLITGDTKARLRDQYVQEYTNTPNAILIGTIAAIKEGLNLQAGRNCVFLEQSDLEDENAQFVARFKRRGQRQLVRVVKIFANGPDAWKDKAVRKRAISVRKAMLEEFLSEPL